MSDLGCNDPNCPHEFRVRDLEQELIELRGELDRVREEARAAFDRLAVVPEKSPPPGSQPLVGPLHRSHLLNSLHYGVEGVNGRRVPACGATQGYMTSTRERVGCKECLAKLAERCATTAKL